MTETGGLHTLVRAEDLQEIRRPELEAANLPTHYYSSPEIYELELQHIFFKEWSCVGRVEDVPNVGDYFTRTIATEPIVVVREPSGEIRAHLNVCRHRSCAIVEEGTGNAKSFRCPYHGWMYALDGELRAAPEFQETHGFRKADYPLLSVKVEIWEGFIFVNFDPDATSWAGRVSETTGWGLDKYWMGRQITTHRWEYELETNWKTYVENYIEEYHLPWVHAETFQAVAPMKGWKDFPDFTTQPWEIMIGQYPEMAMSDSGKPLFPFNPELLNLPIEYQGMPIWLAYPTFMCIPSIDATVYYVAFPDGPEKTRIMLRLCVPGETAERYHAGDPEIVPQVEQYARNTEAFIAEDNVICEMQTKGQRSRHGLPGRYCKHEPLVWKLHNWLVETAYSPALQNGRPA